MHTYFDRPGPGPPGVTARAPDDGMRLADSTWARVGPLLPPPPSHPLGCHRPRVPQRRALDAILLRLRTGCRWSDLDATGISSGPAAFRRSREWLAAGVFEAIRAIDPRDEALIGLDWSRLAPRASRRRTGPIEG